MNTLTVPLVDPMVRRRSPSSRSTAAFAAAVTAALALTGCSNISGLGGSSEFGCKAPVGVPCMSVSGVHENERIGNLPSQRPATKGASSPAGATAPSPLSAPMSTPRPTPLSSRGALTPVSDTAAAGFTPPMGALRSDPTVIRIWVAPWEDADGDLVDQAYVYLQIDSGRWLIEHNREAIRRTFGPRASGPASTAAAPASRSASMSPRGSLAAPVVGGVIATTTGNNK